MLHNDVSTDIGDFGAVLDQAISEGHIATHMGAGKTYDEIAVATNGIGIQGFRESNHSALKEAKGFGRMAA